jgi:zinc/manganese transport system substrate-binding protein
MATPTAGTTLTTCTRSLKQSGRTSRESTQRTLRTLTLKQVGFEASGLAGYKAVITEIRTRFATTPVGASESIFAMLAPALGLRLITPPGFLRAMSQGIDPTVADKTTIDSQIRSRAIKVYVYNSQNATPDVQAQIVEARANSIPVTTITETMIPATASWQQWQTSQLIRLRDALAKAVGR